MKPSSKYYDDNLEILVKSFTEVGTSPTAFKIDDLENVGSKSICLADVPKMNRFDRVTVKIKTIRVEKPEIVGNGKRKQDVVIADSSGSSVLTLWESNINSLVDDSSYQLSKLTVQFFKGNYYLSFPSNAIATPIEDVADAVAYTPPESTEHSAQVEIASVSDLLIQYQCIICSGTVQLESPIIGRCYKCLATQKISHCKKQLSAKLGLFANNSFISVRAYEDVLTAIVDDREISEENLLDAKPFIATYNKFSTITSVHRSTDNPLPS